jgi:alpha-N-arabinofuranosidase
VNPQATAEALKIQLQGVSSVASKAAVITLAGNPDDSNSITQPRKVVPISTTLRGVKPAFSYVVPPNSIVVLKLKAR